MGPKVQSAFGRAVRPKTSIHNPTHLWFDTYNRVGRRKSYKYLLNSMKQNNCLKVKQRLKYTYLKENKYCTINNNKRAHSGKNENCKRRFVEGWKNCAISWIIGKKELYKT